MFEYTTSIREKKYLFCHLDFLKLKKKDSILSISRSVKLIFSEKQKSEKIDVTL